MIGMLIVGDVFGIPLGAGVYREVGVNLAYRWFL
jgi:hypothetical protein